MTALFKNEGRSAFSTLEQASRTAIETALTVALGVLIGRLAWTVLEPLGGSAVSSEASASQTTDAILLSAAAPAPVLTRANPFGASVSGAIPASGEPVATNLPLRLVGVRAVVGNTAASSAVIALEDGTQKRLVPGDEAMPGVILVNISQTEVHFSRAGMLEALRLARPGDEGSDEGGKAASELTLVKAAAGASSSGSIAPDMLVADTILTPEFRGGEVSGYRLMPRGAGAFEAAGLEPGDMILRVNGEAVEGLHPAQISETVASRRDVNLDIVRQGAIIRVRIAPETYLSQ